MVKIKVKQVEIIKNNKKQVMVVTIKVIVKQIMI